MLFAVIREAAEAASTSGGPFHGYPPWLVALVGTIVAVIALWIFAKLVKWTFAIIIVVVLIGGVVAAGRMFFGL